MGLSSAGSSRLLLLPAAIPALQVSRELLIAESVEKDWERMSESLIFREKPSKQKHDRTCFCKCWIDWLVLSTGKDIVLGVFVRRR